MNCCQINLAGWGIAEGSGYMHIEDRLRGSLGAGSAAVVRQKVSQSGLTFPNRSTSVPSSRRRVARTHPVRGDRVREAELGGEGKPHIIPIKTPPPSSYNVPSCL